jgi:hypothetical protein
MQEEEEKGRRKTQAAYKRRPGQSAARKIV